MNDNMEHIQYRNDIESPTIENAIQEMARRLSSDFFLHYVREKVNNNENIKVVLKIKKSSNVTGYSVSLNHITETKEKALGVLTHLK
jgi:hypothetical protein